MRNERPPEALNFCRVFEMPTSYPGGYCFDGGKPVTISMVDWFNPWPSDGPDTWDEVEDMLRDFLSSKLYIKPARRYLVLTDFDKAFVVNG